MPAVLRFELEHRAFGLVASDVREVLRAAKPSPLPEAPALVLGVLNVRGESLPIYDVRGRFGLASRPMRASDAIVVVRAHRWVGIVVDRALDLVDSDGWDPPIPSAGLVRGTALLPDGCLVICDLEAFLSEAEERTLDRALEAHG